MFKKIMDFMKPIEDFGSKLDWVTPAFGLAHDIVHKDIYDFFVPLSVSKEVIDILEGNNIPVWGRQITGQDEMMLTIKSSDVERANKFFKP